MEQGISIAVTRGFVGSTFFYSAVFVSLYKIGYKQMVYLKREVYFVGQRTKIAIWNITQKSNNFFAVSVPPRCAL